MAFLTFCNLRDLANKIFGPIIDNMFAPAFCPGKLGLIISADSPNYRCSNMLRPWSKNEANTT